MDERDPSDSAVAEFKMKLKAALKRKYESRIDEIFVTSEQSPTEDIDLYEVEHEYEEALQPLHDLRHIVAVRYRPHLAKVVIDTIVTEDLVYFDDPHDRVILTQGVAGIGKTRAVQRYILNWVKGKENQHLDFLFPLPCRELNILFKKGVSLHGLIYKFFPELQELGLPNLENYNVLFIFDGLDELCVDEDTELRLNFDGAQDVSDPREVCVVDDLLTNLIKRNLLPSACVWLTSRPMFDCFPLECVSRMTEIRGFSNSQIEEFFRKTINNDHLAARAIAHVKSCGILYITCQIPAICSATASVLKGVFEDPHLISKQIPKTLTQVYAALVGRHTKDRRHAEASRKIGRLEKLAMHQLMKNSEVIYEKDLKRADMDVSQASECAKTFTDIFREEIGPDDTKLFYFAHNTIQEYLAATHLFHTRIKYDNKPFERKMYLLHVLKTIEDKKILTGMMDCTVDSKRGHLDLFLLFLLGTSRDFTVEIQSLVPLQLPDLMGTVVELVKIKALQTILIKPERTTNLLWCLKEMQDETLEKEVRRYLEVGHPPDAYHNSAQWSSVSFEWLSLEGCRDEVFQMDLKRGSDERILATMPLMQASKTALLHFCNLTAESCITLGMMIGVGDTYTREMDLGFNSLNAGIRAFCAGLAKPECKLEKLKLTGCGLTKTSCKYLAEALKTNCQLKELDLSSNELEDSGASLIAQALGVRDIGLNTLKLSQCKIGVETCTGVATSLIKFGYCDWITNLDFSINDIGDQGVNQLILTLMKLERYSVEAYQCNLSLYGCGLTEGCCQELAGFLDSETCPTRLNLSSNKLMDSGVTLLSRGLKSKWCCLKELNLANCGVTEEGCVALASALDRSHSSPGLLELDLSRNQLSDAGVNQLAATLKKPVCLLTTLRLSYCGLTEKCCAALASALGTDYSPLKELDLCGNELKDQGAKMLCVALRLPRCNLTTLSLRCCGITEEGFSILAKALRSNPRHLTELNLMGNDPGESGVQLLYEVLDDPYFNLTTLDIVVEADHDKLKPHHLSKLAW